MRKYIMLSRVGVSMKDASFHHDIVGASTQAASLVPRPSSPLRVKARGRPGDEAKFFTASSC